jgi:methylated-DNA-[protein]-cysteine S-methyltransferase
MLKWTAVELAQGAVLFVKAEGDALRGAVFGKDKAALPAGWREDDRDDGDQLLREAAKELRDYMAGKRRVFCLPFELDGTGFQCRVWAELTKIPFGELSTYAGIAKALGQPRASRAVGAAIAKNPLPVIVPCHRVIASDGTLAGYSGGIGVKRLLLRREGIEL